MGKLKKTFIAVMALSFVMGISSYAGEAPRIIYDPSVTGESSSQTHTEKGFIDEAGLQLINDAQKRQVEANSLDALMNMDVNMNMNLRDSATGEAQDMAFGIGLDLAMKMKDIESPQTMKYIMDMKMTMPGIIDEPLDMKMFYADGWLYSDTSGVKTKQYMDPAIYGDMQMTDSMQQILNSSTYNTDFFKSLTVTSHNTDNPDGNTVLSYTMDGREIMEYVNNIYAAIGFDMSELGFDMNISDIKGDITVNSAGYITRDTMDMTINISGNSQGIENNMAVVVKADVTYNNPGSPVDFNLPSTEGYEEIIGGADGLAEGLSLQ